MKSAREKKFCYATLFSNSDVKQNIYCTMEFLKIICPRHYSRDHHYRRRAQHYKTFFSLADFIGSSSHFGSVCFRAPQAYLEINHTRKPERNRVRARDSARSPKRKIKSACSLMLSSIIILAFFPEFISHNFCAVLSFPLNGYSAL